MKDDTEITGAKADEILKEARTRFKLAVDAEADMREQALSDLKFLDGEQWDEAATKVRKNRPCLTINRLPQYVRQVVNEQRKTRPAIDVSPADSSAAKPTADVIQGMVRHIERSSRARVAYDTCFEYAVSCGIGHFRVATKYVDDNSFDQELVIGTIDNPFVVYRDPSSHEPDHSDDRFTFVSELVDKDEFEERYGFKPTEFEDAGTGDDVAEWFDDDMVRVAEYWRIECEEGELIALSDGTTIEGPLNKDRREELQLLGVEVRTTRKVEKKKVEQYLLTFDKVIKKSAWLGQYIPILTTVGGQVNIEGKRKISSLIRWAKDPARMYNYWASAETELVALQPKAPFIGPEGSFDGHENEWARANVDNAAYLEYAPVEGQPGPQRQMPAPLPMGVREGRMAAAEDIKSTLGMYDASIGARSNETSGVAIKARQQEGDTGTFHFIDNHARSIEQCGRIIIDLLPKIYDTPRVVRIVGPNDEEQMVAINQHFIDPQSGEDVLHDLSIGRYEVAVRVGPSFESKRQEMVQAMIEISTVNPEIMKVAGDLVLKNMDWPQSEEIAKRLFMTLPPQMRGDNTPPPPDPAMMLAQAQIKTEEIKATSAAQRGQAEQQTKAMDVRVAAGEMEVKQAELQVEQEKINLEREKLSLEREKIAFERDKLSASMAMAQQAPAPMLTQ